MELLFEVREGQGGLVLSALRCIGQEFCGGFLPGSLVTDSSNFALGLELRNKFSKALIGEWGH